MLSNLSEAQELWEVEQECWTIDQPPWQEVHPAEYPGVQIQLPEQGWACGPEVDEEEQTEVCWSHIEAPFEVGKPAVL